MSMQSCNGRVYTAERSRRGCSIVTVLFTASSVRVDRRGTCSNGSRAAAARARGGSRRRCRARSRAETWRSARAAPDPAAAARAPAASSTAAPAATCAAPTAASTGTRTGSTTQTHIYLHLRSIWALPGSCTHQLNTLVNSCLPMYPLHLDLLIR